MKRLRLEHVTRSFGGLHAVSDVDMHVEPGRVTGLIGPNGAGKSTVVNLITGLLTLDQGRVLLEGADIAKLEPPEVARLGIARTFQNVRLLKEASVLDNVVAGLYLQDDTSLLSKLVGLPVQRRQARDFKSRAAEQLTRFRMTEYAALLAGELPYGHQRRVEIMRALVRQPAVLLLDEPCAGMNDAEAHVLGKAFRALAAEGLAVLLIEHNMRLVLDICDDIYVLASGKIIGHGSPGEIRQSPAVIDAYLGTTHA